MSRGLISRSVGCSILAALACAFASRAEGATVWNEGTNGDLSNSQAAPTALATSVAVNSVIGTVNGSAGDSQDWIRFNVPSGNNLTSVVLQSYTSSDTQGFTGLQAGT